MQIIGAIVGLAVVLLLYPRDAWTHTSRRLRKAMFMHLAIGGSDAGSSVALRAWDAVRMAAQ